MSGVYDQRRDTPGWAPVVRFALACLFVGFAAATLLWKALLG